MPKKGPQENFQVLKQRVLLSTQLSTDVQRNATNITTPLSTHGYLFEAIGLAAFHQQYPNEAHVTAPTHPGDLPRGSTFDFPERQARHNDAIAAWTDHANAQIALSRYILTVYDDEYVRAYLQTGDKAPAPWMLFEYLTRDYVALTLTAQDIEGVKVGMLREIKLSTHSFAHYVDQIETGRRATTQGSGEVPQKAGWKGGSWRSWSFADDDLGWENIPISVRNPTRVASGVE